MSSKPQLYDALGQPIKPKMRPTVICDLDGTLCNVDHRRHHVVPPIDQCVVIDGKLTPPPGWKPNWAAFFRGIDNDTLVTAVFITIEALRRAGMAVVLCSGRGEALRGLTERWLKKHNVNYDALYMRGLKDPREDNIVKRELLEQIRKDGFGPILAIDDRNSVVDMWRSEGLTCFQAAPGNF